MVIGRQAVGDRVPAKTHRDNNCTGNEADDRPRHALPRRLLWWQHAAAATGGKLAAGTEEDRLEGSGIGCCDAARQDLNASARPMTIRWIWLVPSTICSTLASRISRSAGKSST